MNGGVTSDDVKGFVLAHVAPELRAKGISPDAVPDEFDLLLEGVIDSFGLLDLIVAVERQFGLQLDFEDFDAEDTTVVGPFSRYVAGKVPA